MSYRLKIPSNYIKTITVRTCIGIYDELRLYKPMLFKNAPLDGVDLTIKYADNFDPHKKFDKTIVAIHGGGDTFSTFYKMFEHFSEKNVRVIAPNLPDFSHTRQTNYSYWHTNIERYYFLKDFLHKIDIKTIDCIVGHSWGIQPISSLWEKVYFKF